MLADELKLFLFFNLSELEDSEEKEDKDTWYNQFFNSEDSDNDLLELYFIFLISLAFILLKMIYKEYSTRACIKVIYMLE